MTTIANSTEAESSEKASQLEQELRTHWLADAKQREAEGRFTAAISAIRELLKIVPASAAAKSRLQQLIEKQRDFDDLQSTAEHAMRNGEYAQALALFTKVTQIRPDASQAFGRMGALNAELGDRAKAKELLNIPSRSILTNNMA